MSPLSAQRWPFGCGAHARSLCVRLNPFAPFFSRLQGIQAFAERWIYGSGCPRVFLERHYIRSRNVLELKLRQSGSAACRRGALRAARKQGADDSHSTIKVCWGVQV